MPIAESTANKFLEYGVAGASLLIILIVIFLLFKMMEKLNHSEGVQQNSRIDKLCDKIDSLITSFSENTQKLNEVLINNDKDQKATNRMLDRMVSTLDDLHERVVRIEERTLMCPRQEELKRSDD